MAYIDRDKVLKAVEKMDRLDKETKTKYEYDKKGFLLLINSAPTALKAQLSDATTYIPSEVFP